MKLRYISDIHLEFIKKVKITKTLDKIGSDPNTVLILAGDIGHPESIAYDRLMRHVNENFEKVFVIAGNHEYYGSSIEETTKYLLDYFETHDFDRISFLNNSSEEYRGYRFIGTTLWSKVSGSDPPINDLFQISDMSIERYNSLNQEAIRFLESQITDNSIIITHHMPSNSLIDRRHRLSDLNHWFYSDLDDFISEHKDQIKCWIYGHTHSPSVQNINGVPCLCNPVGYPGENKSPDFLKDFKLSSLPLISHQVKLSSLPLISHQVKPLDRT